MWIKSSKCEQGACVEVEFSTSSKCEGGSCVEVGFTTSTKCDTNACVEVGFAKSTKCNAGECVEVQMGQDVAVRNSKIPGEVVWFDHDEWRAFVAGVKGGEFDI